MAGGRGEPMICLAHVAAAHGVRGALKLRCFTERPENVAAYGPLCDAQGQELFAVRVQRALPGGAIVTAEGIADRDAAEALRGIRLYVPRSRLPALEPDEFYHEDLVGLAVRDASTREIGRVRAVLDFGGGEMLEIETARGESELVPFTRAAVPEIDLARGTIVVAPPEAAP